MERMECLRLLSRTFDLGRQCPVWLHLSSASLALSLYLGDLLLLVVLVGASKGYRRLHPTPANPPDASFAIAGSAWI